MKSEQLPLFLLPGLMCDDAVWEYQRAKLGEHTRITVPNFRGFDSITAMAGYVLDNAPDKFAVAGHSMGGRVALELVNMVPERIAKLALLDTGVHPKKEGEESGRQIYLDLARAGGMRAVADAWIKPMVHPDRHTDADLINAIVAMIERTNVEEFCGQIRALLTRPDASKYLPGIRCHTLIMCGRQDSWASLEQHEAMLAEIPSTELVIIEDAGHMTPMEQPEAVTNALRKWLLG